MKPTHCSICYLCNLLLTINTLFIAAAHAENRVIFCADKEAAALMFDLYSMRADGSDLQRLTVTPAVSEWAPALSPNGQRLAYIAQEQPSWAGDLFLIDLTNRLPVKAAISGKALAVQWADDHTLFYLGLAGTKWGSPLFDIRKINVDGTGETVVYAGPFWVYPTGADRFSLWQTGGRLFFTSSLESGPVRLRSGLITESAPDTTYVSGVETLYAPDDEPKIPGDMLIDHYDLTISPAGNWLAYCADHGTGYHRLYLRNGNGDAATQQRLSDAFCADPDFSPDSSFIVFTRASQSTYGMTPYIGNLIRIDIDGTHELDLTSGISAVSGRCAHPVVYAVGGTHIQPITLRCSELLPASGLRLSWTCEVGMTYQVEYSPNLSVWHKDLPDSRITAKPGDIRLEYSDLSPRQTGRFYRISLSPNP